jgi:hypothetical protein
MKSVLPEDVSITTNTPLVIGDRTYMSPTINLPPGLIGKLSGIIIVLVDPNSYTKEKLSSAIIRITMYDLEGKETRPTAENPLVFSIDIDPKTT